MWNLIGIVAALAVGTVAWQRSRAGSGGFYDEAVYGMSPLIHRRYAVASFAFAAFFAVTFVVHAYSIGIAGLAVYTLIAILYGASFLRGASDEHE
jgi:hypothetical protein